MAEATFGRLQAALASATNEVTVAAANINFDFALVKVEAPAEYQPLGVVLSAGRKKEAETGSLHVTARRLGALFQGLCPPSPNLIKAYGKRVSEISKVVTETSATKHSSWIFPELVGIDATSIWAAVTSSTTSIHAHLLACMLARIWNEAEAISVWVEIIEERRREIATKFEQGEEIPFASTTAATQQPITRDQLASWDASARAWLRSADAVKCRQQKQLLLIIENISLSVNDEPLPYQSVKKAWITAMETVEKIICGGAYAVRDGTILVALSAWHLYPDLCVYRQHEREKEIAMKDDLIQNGGVLSLGLVDTANRLNNGVYWSLPLRHFKFYGRPVRKTRTLQIEGNRMTFTELLQAYLGIMLQEYNIDLGDTALALQLSLALLALLRRKSLKEGKEHADQWIDVLTDPILAYFEDQQLGDTLVSLGRRRARSLRKKPGQLFELLNLNNLLKVLRGPGSRIELLRRVSLRLEDTVDEVLIGFLDDTTGIRSFTSGYRKYVPGDPGVCARDGRTGPYTRWVYETKLYPRQASEILLPLSSRFLSTAHLPVPLEEIITKDGLIFNLLAGSDKTALLYTTQKEQDEWNPRVARLPPLFLEDLKWCLQEDMIDPVALRHYFHDIILDDGRCRFSHITRFVKLARPARLYGTEAMQGATVHPGVLGDSNEPRWSKFDLVLRKDHSTGENEIFERGVTSTLKALQIVAYFEAGYDILDPLSSGQDLKTKILGLSVGDSLYLPQALLADPIEQIPAFNVVRLLGNVGKSGIVLLRSPSDVMVRELDHGAWRVVSASRFDGKPLDCFGNTTLHLNLTEWSSPIMTEQTFGQRDVEASMMEAVLSIRDSGAWVADINVPLKDGLHDTFERPILASSSCMHPKPSAPATRMSPIETWDQVLDHPVGLSVVQANGNWLARLAVTAVLRQHLNLAPKDITICPPGLCWACVKLDSSGKDQVWIF
ncbi:hypothetical protein GQ53DRAFT_817292 [Thozetella sp. PMI_491]|nr:hypothetical protein GQ53DRAFT_817292 [Thozetella sp. PMI_491]